MRIDAIELRLVEIPMAEPLAAAHGVTHARLTTFVHVVTDIGEGWGECAALNEPTYTGDWTNGSYLVMQEIFVPTLLKAGELGAADVRNVLEPFKQNNFAKAALEMACLDVELKQRHQSLAQFLGSTNDTVESTVVIGLGDDDFVLRSVEEKLRQGFNHVKLKIAPGRDIRRIDLVRQAHPALTIRVDANGSYDWDDPEHRRLLGELAERDIDYIEQPLPPERARWMSELRRELKGLRIALDESIMSFARAVDAMELNMCDVVVVKPGIIGGYFAARELHDTCERLGKQGTVGGMIDAPLCRAANLAVAALPNFSRLPAEVAPDGRWFSNRLSEQTVDMDEGSLLVPQVPGIGATLDMQELQQMTVRSHTARRSAVS